MLHNRHTHQQQQRPLWSFNHDSPRRDGSSTRQTKTRDELKYLRQYHESKTKLKQQKYCTKILVMAFIVTFVFGTHLQTYHMLTVKNLTIEIDNLNTTQTTQFNSLKDAVSECKGDVDRQRNLVVTAKANLQVAMIEVTTLKEELGLQRKLNGSNYSKQMETDTFNYFRRSIRTSMKLAFPSQSQDLWIQILGGALSTMSDETPTRPSSILILSPSCVSPDFGPCFARKLALAVSEAFWRTGKEQSQEKEGKIKEIESGYFNSMWTAEEISEELKSYLNNEGKAIVIHNPDQILGEKKLLVLQGLNDMRANFIFTITVPVQEVEYDWSSQWNAQQIVHRFLDEAWVKSLSDEKIRAALISRIVGNVVLLQEGDSCA